VSGSTRRRVGVGVSDAAHSATAASEAAARAASGLNGEACDLAVVFASAAHVNEAETVLDAVREVLEPAALIGCAAVGILGDGRELESGPAISVWAGALDGGDIETFHFEGAAAGELESRERQPDQALVLLADPFTHPAGELLENVERVLPGIPVIGGLASASPGVLFRDDEVYRSGAVAALISGIQVLPCVSQGAEPVGPEMAVTAAHGNVIAELAGKPAMERLAEVIEALTPEERQLAAGGVLLGVVIDENRPEHMRGDFLVRPIAAADRESGAIALGEEMRVGQTVRLHVRDAASADADLREALRDQAYALGSDGAAGALLFTCNGRGSNLFDVPDHDASAVHDALGAPAAGFFCAGEIGPVGGRNFLHGYTATMAVIPAA
jgi:small ligand-binding sensory domain FIST